MCASRVTFVCCAAFFSLIRRFPRAGRLAFTMRFSLLILPSILLPFRSFVVFLVARSTAKAALLVLRMVPYVAAASCSGGGRTPRAVAWSLALAAGARIIDAKKGSFWHLATGGTSSYGDGYGLSCDDACATPATGGCDASGMGELATKADFNLAKPDAMSCSGYSSQSSSFWPGEHVNGGCIYNTGGTSCDSSHADHLRLCACTVRASAARARPSLCPPSPALAQGTCPLPSVAPSAAAVPKAL